MTLVASQNYPAYHHNSAWETEQTNFPREIGLYLSFAYFLVRWHLFTFSLSPADIILAQLACPLNDTIIYLQSGITNHKLF